MQPKITLEDDKNKFSDPEGRTEGTLAYLEGFRLSAGSLPSIKDAMYIIVCLIYGDSPAELQIWEKLPRNAEKLSSLSCWRRFGCSQECVWSWRLGYAISSNMSGSVEANRRISDPSR